MDEAQAGSFLGVVTLVYLLCSVFPGRFPDTGVEYAIAGVAVGFCFLLFQSSIRRGDRRSRWIYLLCGGPSALAIALWLLAVIAIVIHHWLED